MKNQVTTDIMENYYVVESEDSPSVYCDAKKGLIEITGKSLPENADVFYNPLIEWFKKYLENPRSKTTIEFVFYYLNSSSSKKILEILLLLKEKLPEDQIEIKWGYKFDDEDMLEEGKDYSNMTQLTFTFNKFD